MGDCWRGANHNQPRPCPDFPLVPAVPRLNLAGGGGGVGAIPKVVERDVEALELLLRFSLTPGPKKKYIPP